MSIDQDTTSLADIVRAQAGAQPAKLAFIFEGEELSYRDLDTRTNQTANGLISLGVSPSDRVGYLGKNSHHYYELLMGVSKARGVTCPINWRLAVPEIAYVLNDAKARILFVGPEFVGTLNDLQNQLEFVETIIVMEPTATDLPVYSDWRNRFPINDPHLPATVGDDAVQLYTSGTTGNPKGAVLSNRALLATHKRANIPDWNTWTNEDVSLVAMPCFHIGGTAWGITGMANGATGVVMREFDATKILDFIEEFGISKLFLVPAAMQFVVNQPKAKNVDFSRLKYMLYGASPIPLDLLRQCMEVFGCGFVQMYGMTETSGTIVALPPEDHDPNGNEKMRSAGKPLEGSEVAIFDEAGKPLPPHAVGEIAIRSDMNMTRYWNLPDATQTTLVDGGWLRSGDAGFIDDDGYVYVQDRVKDMIISGGENIYPAEVENAIYGHPDIADVAVIGVPDDTWGEAVKACVVLRNGATVSAGDVIAFSKERIASYKCPKSIDFIEEMPRNPSGKILRRELRERYWENKERAVN